MSLNSDDTAILLKRPLNTNPIIFKGMAINILEKRKNKQTYLGNLDCLK
jgi:hypothetical protein